MPIVDVQLVGDAPGHPEPPLAASIAEALAAVLGSPPGRLWVRLAVLPAAAYAENGTVRAAGPGPVFVRVLHADLPAPEALAREARAMAEAVALCVACPAERVHVEYAPPGRGRVAFGGQLLT